MARVAPYGSVLVTPTHLTLYVFAHDARDVSRCTGACAKVWPPYELAAGQHVHAPSNVHGVGTLRRGGRLQLTIDGHPLYRFSGDRRAGQTFGEGLDHLWWVVGAAGTAVHAPRLAAPAPPPTTAPETAPTTVPPITAPAPAASVPATTPPPTVPPSSAPPVTAAPVTAPPVTAPPPPTTTPTTSPPPPTTTPGGGGGGGYGY